ncbi:MAG TPA: winged helix-turn-helix domain-containing protein [Solirubrobacterales bacterium]|nr:winged helix-turn-helix domain-containing protein [Solirubrobacterales bacterium]
MSEAKPISPITRSLIRAMSHPVKGKIIACLGEGLDLTARQIADRSETPLRSVRHHLSQLEKAGVVERSAQERRRGVQENYYRLAVTPVFDAGEYEGLSPSERLRVSTGVLKMCFSDVSVALSGGTFDRRFDRCLAYVRVNVDERGWRELAAMHLKTYEEVERVKAECAERLRSSGEQPIRGVSGVLWFELPA